MGLNEDLALIMQKLDIAIEQAMTVDVADAAKEQIARSVEENVYAQYEPEHYERKMENGGLQDKELMSSVYHSAEHLLEMTDDRRDTEQGRFNRRVADIVEGGWETQPFPRPFHQPAERAMIETGEFERALGAGLERAGFPSH